MNIKKRVLQYIEYKGVSRYKFYQETGFSNGFLDKEGSIGADKCEKISYQYPDMNIEWLITGRGNMLRDNKIGDNKNAPQNKAIGNQNIIVGGNNNSSIDNRRYYSDSPDILKAQIDDKDKLLREKDERLREKDERLREKDAYILELKETITELKGK
jgi:hypothetical protein